MTSSVNVTSETQSAVAPVIDREALNTTLANDLAIGRETDKLTALILINLSGFRQINRRYGFAVGDSLLAHVHSTLQEKVTKASLVCRIGGDVFAVVVPLMQSRLMLPVAATKIQQLLAEPFNIQKDEIRLQCHIGISVAPEDANQAANLLSHAEKSLAIARKRVERIYVAEESSNDDEILDEWKIREGLHIALVEDEFCLLFQPKVCLRTFTPVACETLVRWNSASLGPVSPELFIPIAEECGLINVITERVIMSLPRSAEALKFRGQALNISINLSPIDLMSSSLSATLESALNIWGLAAENITLEITESAVMESPEHCFQLMEKLKQQGFRISIDDFGTGYSSMSYFKLIPANEIKIDKYFVSNLCTDKGDQAIVKAVISIAHDFNMSVVAEGVEDEATLKMLAQLGCDYAQGYHFSKPLPAEEFSGWLDNYKMWDYMGN